MLNYRSELEQVIYATLFLQISELATIRKKRISELESIDFESIDGFSEKKVKSSQGKIFSVSPKGSFSFINRLPDDARLVTMKFHVKDMKISFDEKYKVFAIHDPGRFQLDH